MSEEQWEAARLIPISGIGGQDEKERRAASALLAVLGAVKEFGRSVLGKIGAPASGRQRLPFGDSFLDVSGS